MPVTNGLSISKGVLIKIFCTATDKSIEIAVENLKKDLHKVFHSVIITGTPNDADIVISKGSVK